MLIRLDATWTSQSGAPVSHESSHRFALTKI